MNACFTYSGLLVSARKFTIIIYFALFVVVWFFFGFVSYFIILNLLLFITPLYATYHDHGTWFVRLQLCYLE